MSYNYWISLHSHTMYSNNSYFEVATKPEDYIAYARKYNLPAVCITEHGGLFGWIKKKEMIEAHGMKYIHGIEAYVTMDLDDKNRGYHTILIAKNYEGVKEINRLSSQSFNRQDGHFYYRPRILFDDLKVQVEHGNIFVTTACMGGALHQSFKESKMSLDKACSIIESNSEDQAAQVFKNWVEFALENKDRVFLEVQPHYDREQAEYNELLSHLSNQYGLRLVAANDIHALNQQHDKLRKLIKKGKRSTYDDEDNFELWCKDRAEMVTDFQRQGVLDDTQIQSSLDMTVDIVNSVEEFEIDKSHKYPKLYEDPEKEFKRRIKEGLIKRGIDKLPADQRKQYIERVNHEYKVYKGNGAIDYMLSHEDILNAAKERGVKFGFGRGSVSGSLIAYLCGQTDMDAVKLGLNFERFMNPERISLADIDVDAYKDDQQWIQKWILTNPKWHAASIMTANTYGLKGAIKVIAAGMEEYTGKPAYVQSICNQIEDDGSYSHELYIAHKELFDNAKEVIGVIDSFGRHAAGIVIDTNTIDDTMGTQTISGWDYPVTQVAMKEIDHFNWVKYDMLGLDNVGLINKAAELAGLEHPTPDSDFIDFEDEKVWNSMRSDNIGIFQMEGDRAGKLLRDMLSPETIANIRSTEVGKKVKYMDLLSLVNAAQRPSGASYVDAVTHGRFKDNGHPALNEFLAPTLGFLVYQEQLIEFLVRFCGYSAGQADLTRRAIGKKMADVIEKEVPEIHKAFVKTMVNKYDDNEEHAEKVAKDFMQVFMDAANYGFSINHSMAYSYIGYISTWLRYYYPLEWCTAAFEVWKDKQDKIVKVSRFAKEHDIKIKPVKFGKSKGLYFMNKEENAIYEGTASIKGLNAEVGDYLYLLSDKKYKNFTEFLLDIYDNNVINYQGQEYSALALYSAFKGENLKFIDLSIKKGKASIYKREKDGTTINKTHMINLILLNYFEQFGSPARLKTIYKFFKKIYKPNNKLLEKKQSKYYECLNFERELEVEDYSLVECLRNEFNLLGRCITVIPNMPTNYAFITNVKELSNRVRMSIYSIKKGRDVPVFMNKRDYNASGVKAGVIIKVFDVVKRPKNVMIDGHWIKSDTENDIFVRDFAMV